MVFGFVHPHPVTTEVNTLVIWSNTLSPSMFLFSTIVSIVIMLVPPNMPWTCTFAVTTRNKLNSCLKEQRMLLEPTWVNEGMDFGNVTIAIIIQRRPTMSSNILSQIIFLCHTHAIFVAKLYHLKMPCLYMWKDIINSKCFRIRGLCFIINGKTSWWCVEVSFLWLQV